MEKKNESNSFYDRRLVLIISEPRARKTWEDIWEPEKRDAIVIATDGPSLYGLSYLSAKNPSFFPTMSTRRPPMPLQNSSVGSRPLRHQHSFGSNDSFGRRVSNGSQQSSVNVSICPLLINLGRSFCRLMSYFPFFICRTTILSQTLICILLFKASAASRAR